MRTVTSEEDFALGFASRLQHITNLIIKYAKSIPQFGALNVQDQQVLIKEGFFEVFIARTALVMIADQVTSLVN